MTLDAAGKGSVHSLLSIARHLVWLAWAYVHHALSHLWNPVVRKLKKGDRRPVVDKVLVVYLARRSNGVEVFGRFLDSYRQYRDSTPHDLLIIFKGFLPWHSKAEYYATAEGIPFLAMSKFDVGHDIGSFHKAFRKFAYTRYLFMGSFCRVCGEAFIAKLKNGLLSQEHAGIVGPSGSWESSRWHLGSPFPNYAIRTAAFMADRATLDKVTWPLVITKHDAYAFEHGWCCLTRQLMDRGLEPYVVAADGSCFPKESWPLTRTYRQYDQANLLITDKQTEIFRLASPNERVRLATLAWGERGAELAREKPEIGGIRNANSGGSPALVTFDSVGKERSESVAAGDSADELSPRSLTSGSLLVRNTVWNFVSEAAPALAAIVAIPVMIRALGAERFGAFTIIWTLVGYVGVFDLGLGRTLTKLMADDLALGSSEKISPIFWTGFCIMAALGLISGFAFGAIAPLTVYRLLKIPLAFQAEALHAFLILAATIPLLVTGAAFRGTLAAFQKFGLMSAIRIPVGTLLLVGPLAVLPFSRSLALLVAVLAAIRVLEWIAYLAACFHIVPALKRKIHYDSSLVRNMMTFGGWITVSQVVGGQILVYSDRLLLGVLASMSAVAYYTTPYEMIVKLRIIPGAVVGVLFPAFAEGFARDTSRTVHLFDRGLKHIFLAIFPAVLIAVTLAHEGLSLWLGPSFAEHSFRVLQWLSFGVLVNSLAAAPFTLIQAAHRPDVPAKLHLLEVPFYLLVMWILIAVRGVEGAAIAWTIRVVVDGLALFVIARQICPETSETLQSAIRLILVGSFVLLLGAIVQGGIGTKLIFLAVMLVCFLASVWRVLLSSDEKARLLAVFKAVTAE